MTTKHLIIPDCQVKPNVDISYLEWVGNYIETKRPDVIVCIGDFADMYSLNKYDAGTKSYEGSRYKDDLASAHEGMNLLTKPFRKKGKYKPRMVLTLGNHEDRITRVANSDPKLSGTIQMSDLQYEDFGWEVVPYLVPIVIDGIAYAHYFTSGVMGRPVPNAKQLVIKKHMSATMGHVQNWEIHREVRADGRAVIGLFSGSCYLHNEDYLGPQGNTYDRGIWVKHEVSEGSYHPLYVSLPYLASKYS